VQRTEAELAMLRDFQYTHIDPLNPALKKDKKILEKQEEERLAQERADARAAKAKKDEEEQKQSRWWKLCGPEGPNWDRPDWWLAYQRLFDK
jgi:hypothetical protein